MWLASKCSFLLDCSCNFISTPLLYSWHWVKSFPTSTLFHNSQNILQTFDSKGTTEIDFNKFEFGKHSLENILSNLALEMGTVNNNLIITGRLLQPLLLGAVKILHHVTRYETPARKRVFIAYSTNSYHCSKRSGIDTFILASFNGIQNCTHMEKIKLFYI